MSEAAASSILLVDDDEVVLTLIGNVLQSRGLNVVQASNGRDALALISKRFFPVLLTDLQMPLVDGIELAEEVRARGMDETCIVMHTVPDGCFDYERGYKAGVDDYLAKKPPDVEWYARIDAAFKTAALRGALKAVRASLAAGWLNPVIAAGNTTYLLGTDGPQTGQSHATNEDFGVTTQILALTVMPTPKVLLVDDDEIMIERLEFAIVEMGFEVFTATDGAAALALMRQDPMSIVILDRNMPGLDGLELCRSIRQQTWPGYVYVILLTAHDAEEDVLLGLDAGADEYLSKRVSDAELAVRLSAAKRVLSLEHSLKSELAARQRMAMTDALTGAHNRRYFMRYLQGELKRARRHGAELSLLVLDVDYFKLVNDSFGHAAGDKVLQKLVKRIKTFLPRECDWCARLGGEEFAVVFPQIDLAGAVVLAEKLRKSVEELSIRLNSEVRSITISIGVSGLQAMPARETATAEMLLAHADRYLYQSKEGGRNRVTSPNSRALAA
ncbi:MAG: two-component system, cell cycle response regulator [Gammaproteobacteria bacterium]|nr:two-component system, cell cycle response regulator [Gammaproteobacteria bacterium]